MTFAPGLLGRAVPQRALLVGGHRCLTVALVYPLVVDSLKSLPLIGDFIPRTGSMVVMLVTMMMALGLNVVVGYAGLLDLGYVAFYAAGAYVAGWLASQQFGQVTVHIGSSVSNSLSGIHVSMWLVIILAGRVHDDRRDPDRPPDAAPARRLPRNRHARLRRDRAAVREERRLVRRLRPRRTGRSASRRSTRWVSAASSSAASPTRTTCTTGPPSGCCSSPCSAASASATHDSGAPGSRSARTRRLRRPWGCP